jgi:ribose-phosphate pyrophosphokinase
LTVHFKALTEDGLERGVATQFQYPGGELHLKNIKDIQAKAWIADVRFGGLDDLGYAAMLANIAHNKYQVPFVLWLPYIPGARSDHVGAPDPIGVEVYAGFVKAMNPQQVIAIDPHSEVAERYYPNLTTLSPTPLVRSALGAAQHLYHYVIAPDKGATERAQQVADDLDLSVIQVHKEREYSTGKILSIEVPDNIDPDGHGPQANYLVVDDICDGGGTFMGLAEAMDLPREQLGLWVTHGIFSGNAPQLQERYGNIYATDSHPGHGRLRCATMIVPTETYMFQDLEEFG